MEKIDAIDVQILQLLQDNGRMKRNRIAEIVNLSVPSVSDRMRKLEERGVIAGYHAHVNAKRIRYDITAFIRVSIDGSERYAAFIENAREMNEVLEVHSVTGGGSHILKIRTHNTSTLEKLLSNIQAWPGVHSTETSIVLSTYKESRTLEVVPMSLEEEG